MTTLEDAELLRLYADEKSEAAFAELVRRHVSPVYAFALRRVGGDVHLAEDVVQVVFATLARKAPALRERAVLGGWLCRTAHFAARDLVRTESRRRAREQKVPLMHASPEGETPIDWEKLGPVLTESLGELNAGDRDAVWLRFFSGKSFAEIGAGLRLTENAARMRVERALDKLRGGLARRGVTSTAAAIGFALAEQGAMAAPAGLAASVTGAALAGTASLTAGAGIATFMSTTKTVGWGVAVAALLVSLGGNIFWLTGQGAEPPGASSRARTYAAVPNAAGLILLRGQNPAELRDRLRAAGKDEATIRAVLESSLRRVYRERLLADRTARARQNWVHAVRTPPGDDPQLLRELVTTPLEALLGPDPLTVAEQEVRYAFLPPELRAAFGRLDRELPPPTTALLATGDRDVDDGAKASSERERAAVEERRTALVESLTPAQRAEWELHQGPLARKLGNQLGWVEPTPAEFRTLFPIVQEFAQVAEQAGSRGGNTPPVLAAGDRMMQHLVDAFGYDRALDFIWSRTSVYSAYARVAQEENLPATTAGRIAQLSALTAQEASLIHADPARSVEEKRAALKALQEKVRPQLDALMPPAVQQRIAPLPQAWFTDLASGAYWPPNVSLIGALTGGSYGSRKIDQPAGARSPELRLPPPRPAASPATP